MILVVDDKIENLYSLKQVLHSRGFQVDTAQSGQEALVKILKRSYSVIILDVQMPLMDGFEVAEAISGYSKSKDIPIIFLSAVNTDKRFITKGYASGGIDYVVKPVDMDILLLKVKTFQKLYEQKQALLKAKKSLQQEVETRKNAERKKDEFISIASHELKTPLTSIKGYLQILDISLGKENIDVTRKYIQRARIQIEKLNKLVSELLDISKLESGKIQFNTKPFRFNSVLDSTVEIIQHTNKDCNIVVNNDTDVLILGDEVRIEQVLINYLTNALKYSPDCGDIIIDVRITGDNNLQVSVTDFGVGIPVEKQAMVFQKFYRAEDDSNSFQGLGLGLYICAEIIERHRGGFGLSSTEGKGSTFYFSLPIEAKSDPMIVAQ